MLTNQQFLAARLSARYGVPVDCGLFNDGSYFKRRDGQPIPQTDIDAEMPNAEADEAAADDPAKIAATQFDEDKMIRAVAIWAAGKLNVDLTTAKSEILTIRRGLG